jgi:adenosylhomocysteine nucleosidase
MKLAIMGAIHEEIAMLVDEMQIERTEKSGMREYHQGTLWGVPVVLVFSRWGKVASSATAAHLISKYEVDTILFTGVAGGIAHAMRVGDVVIGKKMIQHDLDSRPIFQRYEVPLLKKTVLESDPGIATELFQAAQAYLREDLRREISPDTLREFGISGPQLKTGVIASGDQFFSSQKQVDDLRERLPEVLCVEMEGAAVAQVCAEHGVRFGLVRTISDAADEHASINFLKFIQEVARVYSHGILKRWLGAQA